MSTKASPVSRLLYFVSPFLLWILYTFIAFLINKSAFTGDTRTWSHLAANFFLPSFFVLGTAYLLLRVVAKDNVLRIWIAESTIFAILLLAFALIRVSS